MYLVGLDGRHKRPRNHDAERLAVAKDLFLLVVERGVAASLAFRIQRASRFYKAPCACDLRGPWRNKRVNLKWAEAPR